MIQVPTQWNLELSLLPYHCRGEVELHYVQFSFLLPPFMLLLSSQSMLVLLFLIFFPRRVPILITHAGSLKTRLFQTLS